MKSKSLDFSAEGRRNDREVDGILKIRAPKGTYRFLVEQKRSYLDRGMLNALVAQAKLYATEHRVPLLLFARYIPGPSAERLMQSGINFVDQAGNMHLVLGRNYERTVVGTKQTATQPQLLFGLSEHSHSGISQHSGAEVCQTAAGLDKPPPLILLHENGYKFLAETSCGDDLRLVVAELRSQIVRVGEGHLDVTVGFSNRNDEIGDLGRTFNHMVQQLSESREEAERLHRTQMSRAECLATFGEFVAGLAHEIRNPLAGIACVIDIVGQDLPVSSAAHTAVKDVRAEIVQINRVLTDLLKTARPHLPEIRLSDLNITVEGAVVLARQQVLSTAIRIELQKDPNLPTVEHDSRLAHF